MTQGRAAEPRAGGRAEGPASGAQRSEGMRVSGRAADKAGKGERQMGKDQSQRGQKDQAIGQGRSDRDQARQSKSESDKRGQKDQTIGQGRSDRDQARQSESAKQGQGKQEGTTKGTAQGQSTTTTGANTKPSNAPAQGQTTQQGQGGTTTGANTQGQTNTQAQSQGGTAQSMSGRVQVSAQQQTRLQQSVLSSRNVARVNANSINFRINTGIVVPRNISVVSVSAFPVLIDLYPDFRDDSFFVVDDEIVIMDRSRRIVDVVPAGPRTRFSHARGTGGGSVAALDLSPDEIRIVQEVLIERHLLTGRASGVFDARTREALVTFQRRQGFQATGKIDTRTVAALGVSNKISATQSQTTTGQGQGSAQQNTTGQNTGRANAPAQQNQGQARQNQPATTGQAG